MEIKLTMEELLATANYKYKQKGGEVDEKEFTRDFLLSLSSFGVSKEEIKAMLCAVIGGVNIPPELVRWESLKEQIHALYMLNIGEEDKPNIKPCYDCWLNLNTKELTAYKSQDLFTSNDICVQIKDYREIDENISWKDLVRL